MDKSNDHATQHKNEKESNQNPDITWSIAGCSSFLILLCVIILLIFWNSEPSSNSQEINDLSEIQTERQEAWLNAKNRFSEYNEGDRLYAAQEALNRGDTITAITMYGARNAIKYPDTEKERRFRNAIQTAMDEQSNNDPIQDSIDNINTYLLPELNAIEKSQATFINEDKIIKQFEKFEQTINDLISRDLEGKEVQDLTTWTQNLSDKQEEIFPLLRKDRISQMQKVLFRENVTVSGSGIKTNHVIYEGWAFANNSNIEDSFNTIQPMLQRLRFKKVTFKTPNGTQEYYYTLKTPHDDYIKPPN